MSNKHRAAEVLLSEIDKDVRDDFCESACCRPYICERPHGVNSDNLQSGGGVERVKIDQSGPGPMGDDFYGNIYLRIKMQWVCIPFSM